MIVPVEVSHIVFHGVLGKCTPYGITSTNVYHIVFRLRHRHSLIIFGLCIYICSCKSLKSCLQTDLEEAKAQEVMKLQNTMQEMQKTIEETNALLAKEQEAAKKAIEEAPPVVQEKEVLVEDTKKVESLTEEVESLKV